MILIVGVKNDELIISESRGNGRPEAAEIIHIGDDVIIISTEVVGIEDSISAPVWLDENDLGAAVLTGQ